VDFADVRTVMSETGLAMMGSGIGTGEHRAKVAAEMAVSSPLLEDINLAGAHGILVNVTAGLDLSIGEFEEVGSTVKEFAAEDATVVVGTVIEPEMQASFASPWSPPASTGARRRPRRRPSRRSRRRRPPGAMTSSWCPSASRARAGLQPPRPAGRSTVSRSARRG
jgi:cell division GTPase FtsZ